MKKCVGREGLWNGREEKCVNGGMRKPERVVKRKEYFLVWRTRIKEDLEEYMRMRGGVKRMMQEAKKRANGEQNTRMGENKGSGERRGNGFIKDHILVAILKYCCVSIMMGCSVCSIDVWKRMLCGGLEDGVYQREQ